MFSRDMVCLRNTSVDTLHKGDIYDIIIIIIITINIFENANVEMESRQELCTMNSNTRIAATQCFLGTWFVLGIQL
jgi:hypothetical protein